MGNRSQGARDANRRYKTGRDALTENEVQKLLGACRTVEEDALLSLAIATGIRREDIVAIQTKGVATELTPDGPRLKITFWEAKRNRDWEAIVAGEAAKNVLKQINARRNFRSPYVFPSEHDDSKSGHLSGRSAYNMFQRVLARSGLRPRPFHALRSTCMKMCQQRGWTIEQTVELTGDSWRTVQEHYLTPSEDEMRDVATKKPLVPSKSLADRQVT